MNQRQEGPPGMWQQTSLSLFFFLAALGSMRDLSSPARD